MSDHLLRVPAMGLIVLVGVSGSGKSTFARRHFAPTETISSDFCRGLIADDENDQRATPDAFDVLRYIVGTRLRRGLLTVVDATSVQPADRKSLIAVAKDNDVLVDAIVLDVGESIAVQRNRLREDRTFGDEVIHRQRGQLRRSLRGMRKEGFRRVHVLDGVDAIEAAQIVREPSWNDRRDLTGPFDIVGDVHGCLSELRALLTELGWQIEVDDDGRAVGASHPAGRTAVFVGDLVDRGPDTPGVLRLVMGMVGTGDALCVSGNHEAKLVRALDGRKVQLRHGLAESIAQLGEAGGDFRSAAKEFMSGLISHYVLDDGRLVVAHAGLKEAYHGRSSGRARSFALYGDTTGETDEFGLPVRYPWAREYRGEAMVVYGHTPIPKPEWVNNTICLDTGVVFGGSLSALRYPSREIVSVPAERMWFAPTVPIGHAPGTPTLAVPPDRESSTLRIDDVVGTRWLETEHAGKVKIPAENAAAALEVMSRFAVDPRWLIYLPPTMSPVAASTHEGFLEYPDEAFAAYRDWGVTEVVCEEKHMGSRAVAILARDAEAAARRFGVADGSLGVVYTRTGRSFFDESTPLADALRGAVGGLFDELGTDWLALDGELLPWSAKAMPLIREQYAPVGAAAGASLAALTGVLDAASARGLDVGAARERTDRRAANAAAYRAAYARYVRPTSGLAGVTFAPFTVLAGQGAAYAFDRDHRWQMETVGRLSDPMITPTRHRFVDVRDENACNDATRWWLDLTAAGGEGMVVKPVAASRKAQPGLKIRGREYLRIIYGPDYLDDLATLRKRQVGHKRHLATREHGLGIEALTRFVDGEPLWRVHQTVFAILALESEGVDPRL